MDSQGKVYYLAPSQIKRAIIVLWAAGVPALLFGGSGVGKTTIVFDLINELNNQNKTDRFKAHVLLLSLFPDCSDISGIPFPNKDKTKVDYLMNSLIPFNNTDAGILFLDELDRCPTDVQNSCLQLLLGRKVHNQTLSPNMYVMGALNGSSDIYTTQLSTAAVTRVCTLFVSSHANEFLESYDNWAEENNISPMMRGFARFTPDLLESHEEFEELARATPRTRDMADRILKVIDTTKVRTDDIIKPLIGGVIGKAAAIKFLAYRDMYLKAPDPLSIIKNPEKGAIPTELSVLYALTCALTHHIEDCDDLYTTDQLCKYAIRLPDEIAGMMFRQMARKCDKVVTNTNFNKWSNDHKFILDLT